MLLENKRAEEVEKQLNLETNLSIKGTTSNPSDDNLVNISLVLYDQIVVSQEEEQSFWPSIVDLFMFNNTAPIVTDVSRERDVI